VGKGREGECGSSRIRSDGKVWDKAHEECGGNFEEESKDNEKARVGDVEEEREEKVTYSGI